MSINDRRRPDGTPYPYIIRCRVPGDPTTREWGYETREQADRQRQGITHMFQSAGQTATITLLTPHDVQHFRVGAKGTPPMSPIITPRRNKSAAQPVARTSTTGTRWATGNVIAAIVGVLVGASIVFSAISGADDDTSSTAGGVPSEFTGIDDADEPPLTDEEDGKSSDASCYSPTWGDFSCDTGLPAPDERNTDGSYKYVICDKGEEAYSADCYPYYDELQRWQDAHP